jgi:Immunoglobulin I-set domain
LAKGDPKPVLQWDFNGKQLDSDNIIIDVEDVGEDRLWSNLTIFNISSMDSGIYRCSAKSSFGFVSKNVSLILPEMVENIIIRSHPETFWYFGLILGIFSTIFCFIIFSILYCVLIKIVRNRNRRNIKSSVSFNDQEKKLLDLSITTNERQDFSEINTPSTSTNKTDSIVISLEPSQSHNRDEFPLNVGVFSPNQATYGNIFISVSVTQDAIDNLNDSMYPDLLNMPNRSSKGSFIPIMPRKDLKATTTLENVELNTSSESTLFSSPNFQSFDENYKHPQPNEFLQAKSICEACKANENRFLGENNEYFLRECENKYLCLKYDNMGRRVTADGSHSILSLSEDEQMQDEVIYKRDTIIINNKDIPPTSANDFVSL